MKLFLLVRKENLIIRGAGHGYLGEDFELAVSYILDFLNTEQAAVQE